MDVPWARADGDGGDLMKADALVAAMGKRCGVLPCEVCMTRAHRTTCGCVSQRRRSAPLFWSLHEIEVLPPADPVQWLEPSNWRDVGIAGHQDDSMLIPVICIS